MKKVELPFIVGVMADLSGKAPDPDDVPEHEQKYNGAAAKREFLNVDVDNFDQTMEAIKPRAAFQVPNTLTGEGNLSVDLKFSSMEDFSPAAIAQQIEPMRKLLEARTQLDNLLSYIDGKDKAEQVLAELLQNPELQRAVMATRNPDAGSTGEAPASEGGEG